MSTTLLTGDCRKLLADYPDDHFDSVVTDPPAGIAFMGRDWDNDRGGRDAWVDWLTGVLQEAFRTAKPGAHAVVWALPRTSGWTHRAIEDAGWQVRDCFTHLFASGFPKSHNLPGGLGTALKPAAEFWYLARKPLAESTVARNVARWGTGALNIDAGRIEASPDYGRSAARTDGTTNKGEFFSGDNGGIKSGELPEYANAAGRWPSNVILDEFAADLLDEQSGERKSGGRVHVSGESSAGNWRNVEFRSDDFKRTKGTVALPSSGGASRFFFVAKSSTAERNSGLAGEPLRPSGMVSETSGQHVTQRDGNAPGPKANHHPTVKPISLMRHLVKIVSPPGGLVLDPFMGSGSTGCACAIEGFDFTGIDLDPAYVQIARLRIRHWTGPLFAEREPA